MEKFVVNGGKHLNGVVATSKAKNSYLAILAGCILSNGVVTLRDCPDFADIHTMAEIIKTLGCTVEKCNKDLIIDCRNVNKCEIPKELATKIRSSIFLLGSILGRMGHAVVCYPGGCDIGSRPIDLHLKGLKALGVDIEEKFGMINCSSQNLRGNDVHLDFPSVGATENIMMAGVLAKGTTRIFNSAKEPEVIDLQNFLNKMGAKISGAGTDTIVIDGVAKQNLGDVEYSPMSDRIVAGTYLLAVATCGGDVTVKNVDFNHIYSLINKLRNAGLEVTTKSDSIRLQSSHRPITFSKIETMPYPGFPTDLQPQSLVLQTVSDGTCIINENLFETRLKHVPELLKMGANIITKDRVAIVTGVEKLFGAEVNCTDLRAGAALTIAGLVAEGQTTINNIHNIDRGYEKLDEVLSRLGADIKRID
jgi:UDP-N-acetylglucosamine 1-carboxyvinyltransferase